MNAECRRAHTHRVVGTVAGIVTVLAMACSQVTRVPPAEYGNPGKASAYRVRTVGGALYRVSHFVVSDSTLVIEAFDKSQEVTDDLPALPFAVPLHQVSSVERVEMERGRASLWVFGLGAVILAVLFFSGLSVNLS